MQITTDEIGQTLLHLTKDEWEDYGRLAGYMPEMKKEANAEDENEKIEEVVVEDQTDVIASEKTEIKESTTPNGGIGNQIVIREETAFNEGNYPNLIAEQEKDGLIGPFAPKR